MLPPLQIFLRQVVLLYSRWIYFNKHYGIWQPPLHYFGTGVFLFQMYPASLSPPPIQNPSMIWFPDDDRRRNPARFRYATGSGIFQPQPTDINERECWWLSETEGFFL
ncbi:unnamed protein product [Musa acuminata var. zebrina]